MARDVDQWLERIGLAQYTALFAENKLDLDVLPELTEQDLKELNIPLGHRKKLLRAIGTICTDAEVVSRPVKTAAAVRKRGSKRR